MKEYNPQVEEKMRAIRSEKYLADLMWRVADAMEEVEQGGLLCSSNAYQEMRDLYNCLYRWDSIRPRKSEVAL